MRELLPEVLFVGDAAWYEAISQGIAGSVTEPYTAYTAETAQVALRLCRAHRLSIVVVDPQIHFATGLAEILSVHLAAYGSQLDLVVVAGHHLGGVPNARLSLTYHCSTRPGYSELAALLNESLGYPEKMRAAADASEE